MSMVLGPSGFSVIQAVGTVVLSHASSGVPACASFLWLSSHTVLACTPSPLLVHRPWGPSIHRLSLGPMASVPSSAHIWPRLRQPLPRLLGLLGPEPLV